MEIKNRFLKNPKDSFFIWGPKGTGKSTWIRNIKNAIYIDLMDYKTFDEHVINPGLLIKIVENNPHYNTFIVDNIEEVPAILDSVHLLIERHQGNQFILTVSNLDKLRRSQANFMAGRALLNHLHPFMASEIASDFRLEISLISGLLPQVVLSRNPIKELKSLTNIHIEYLNHIHKGIDNTKDCTRILKKIHQSNGETIRRKSNQAIPTQFEEMLHTLDGLMLIHFIYPLRRRGDRHLARKYQFYFSDIGFANTLKDNLYEKISSFEKDTTLKTLILQHLQAWKSYSKDWKIKIYFWENKGKMKIDFIVTSDDLFHAIEVKNTNRIHSKHLRGLKEFKKDYPTAKLILLYIGTERVEIDGIPCVPVKEFLLNLVPNEWAI